MERIHSLPVPRSRVSAGSHSTRHGSPFGNANLAVAIESGNPAYVGVPDALAPFHLASPSERQRRTRDVLQWAWKVYARGGKSLVESVREAAAGSPVGAFALQQMRHVLLELNLPAWEAHPNRTRADVHRLFRKTISRVSPHRGGWRVTR